MLQVIFKFWLLVSTTGFKAEVLPEIEMKFGEPLFELLLDSVRQVESGGGKYLLSNKGAKGPYQIMDATGWEYHRELKIPCKYDPYDEEQARLIAGNILIDYWRIFKDVNKAVLAYNSGPGNVRKGKIGPQGRAYVPKVEKEFRKRLEA